MQLLSVVTIAATVASAAAVTPVATPAPAFSYKASSMLRFDRNINLAAESSSVVKGKEPPKKDKKAKVYNKGFATVTFEGNKYGPKLIREIHEIGSCYQTQEVGGPVTSEKVVSASYDDSSYAAAVQFYASDDCSGGVANTQVFSAELEGGTVSVEKSFEDAIKLPKKYKNGASVEAIYGTSAGCSTTPSGYVVLSNDCFNGGDTYLSFSCDADTEALTYNFFNATTDATCSDDSEFTQVMPSGCYDYTGSNDDDRDPRDLYEFHFSSCVAGKESIEPKLPPKPKPSPGPKVNVGFMEQITGFLSSFIGSAKKLR